MEFEEFASTRSRRLFQIAYLMCGDWHQAQDLVQNTLAKMFTVWGRLRRGRDEPGLDAYARKVLLRMYLSHKRLRRSGEIVSAELPEQAAGHPTTDLRLTLVAALAQLPPRNRAVVVLRYLEDHSVEAVAELLEVSPGAVKSLSTRSLAKLREILGHDRELLLRP
ncbi:RNA polymerase sigma-70 factor (sigma-E family) [Kitasatospora gansuensis]|uniref:RNA polymerase sigma-70 factor (Sigma-E family) n=1 Tax=Kitasatospora gansuensis TaxID=258050 RepID=A0A7W7SG49_9ACTN|nr:SigE family RNA polymerase sigma factor [Kitasatospora gansuensis]MBB4949840.1 RNA polymerase sigma-70 factor (sigma-E family) [Kitasatospora gansuensis]